MDGFQASSDIRSLIQQKERELHDINEYRITGLETLLKQKDDELAELRSRLLQIRDDFQYNLGLIQERDAELDALEGATTKLRSEKDAIVLEAERLRVQLSTALADGQTARVKLEETDAQYRQQIAGLRDSIEAAKLTRHEELRSWREQLESVRSEASARVQQAEADAQATTARVKEAAEAALAAAHREARRRDDEAAAAIHSADSRAAAALSQLQEASNEAAGLRAAVDQARAAARMAQQEAADARMQLDTARAEFESTLAASIQDRDSAVSARAGLLEEYERRMGGLLSSLKAVEEAFREQKMEHEDRLEATVRKLTGEHKEAALAASAREAALHSRLTEAEASARAAASGLQATSSQAKAEHERADRAEVMLAERERDLLSLKQRHESEVSSLTAQVHATHARLHDALQAGTQEGGALFKAKADAAAASSRAEQAESQLRSIDGLWEQRWRARESELRSHHEAALTAVRQQRDALGDELQRLRADRAGASAGTAHGDGLLPSSEYPVPQPAPGQSTSVSELLHTLAGLEEEVASLRRDKERGRQGAGDAVGFGPASPHGDHDADILRLQTELSVAHSRVLELEDGEARLRAVVADMRAHMEEMQQDFATAQEALVDTQAALEDVQRQLLAKQEAEAARAVRDEGTAAGTEDIEAPALGAPSIGELSAYKASAEAMLASLRSERDGLLAELAASRQYVALLQRKLGGQPAAGDGEDECTMLRRQLADCHASMDDLRLRLRQADVQLARRLGAAQLGDTSQKEASGADSLDLQARVAQLVAERDALLELSNSLRAQLHRAQAHALPHETLRRPPVQAGLIGPPVPSGPAPQPVAAERVTRLEESLARVTAQNNALQADMQRLLVQLQAQRAPTTPATAGHPKATPQPAPRPAPASAVDATGVDGGRGVNVTGSELGSESSTSTRTVAAVPVPAPGQGRPGQPARVGAGKAAGSAKGETSRPIEAHTASASAVPRAQLSPWDSQPVPEGLGVQGRGQALQPPRAVARHVPDRTNTRAGAAAPHDHPVRQSVAAGASTSATPAPSAAPPPVPSSSTGVRAIAEAKAHSRGLQAAIQPPAWLTKGT